MKGWLDRYESGGKMQEHQPNFNEARVSYPPNFVGIGNNTRGLNYNSAWGGPFEQGGIIPKDIKLQQLRHGAPSNGK